MRWERYLHTTPPPLRPTVVKTSVYQKWISEDQNQNQNFHPEIGRHLAEQNSARILVNSYQNSGGIPVVLAQTGTSGGLLAYITGDSGQDTWHGISRYWTQRPATLGARTQDGFSQAFRCPAAVCWPSPAGRALCWPCILRVQAQNLAEFWQSSARTSTCTLYSSGRILPGDSTRNR